MTDDRNYTVTGPGGYRRGSLTRGQAEMIVARMTKTMKRHGSGGTAHIYYRDGTEVKVSADMPLAHLESYEDGPIDGYDY